MLCCLFSVTADRGRRSLHSCTDKSTESDLPRKKTGFDFEKSLGELETIVEKMENGDLTLEESLQHFEKGVALTRACQKALEEAEHKVKILMEKDSKSTLEDFDPEDND